MKKYLHISMDTVEKVCSVFCDDNEMVNFIQNIDDLARELSFISESARRLHDETPKAALMIKEICVLALFFREHIELVHELIKKMKLEEVSEEEFKKLKDV